MNTKLSALLGFGAVIALGAGGGAAHAMPLAALSNADAGGVVQVYHRGRPHRAYRPYRQRIVVQPYGYGYADPTPSPYAYYRGFQDPGFAVRGNIPGNCAVDLGYGRWETCDK
jgi:hypothetical protein